MDEFCLGFFTNPQREDLVAAIREAAIEAHRLGFCCTVTQELQGMTKLPCFEEKSPRIILAFGGDGTILRAVNDSILHDAPICGVNMGRIGFLSEARFDELGMLFSAIKEKRYSTHERMMLDCRLNQNTALNCLNDVLVYKDSYSGVIGIHTTIDGMDTGVVYADGITVSTPTGATGYSISAGGPVIAPGLDVAVITPICPHSLTYRPIIARPDAQIRITVDEKANIALDGNHAAAIDPGDEISLTRSKERVSFIEVQHRNFFNLIRERLS